MPRVEFELTTPVFGRAKTAHTLDRAATVIRKIKLRNEKPSNISEEEGMSQPFGYDVYH
jgi:hypothetical protein